MNCQKIHEGDVDAYVHGELSPAEAKTLEVHSFACEYCAAELRHLREEKRLFRSRADSDDEVLPAFADVLARITREESTVVANDPPVGRVRPLALPKKTESGRSSEGKQGFPRWAQAFVACAATAAAAVSLLGVTPPKSDEMSIVHPHADEMEIGADPICTPENSSASAEVLASLPPREILTNVPDSNPEESATCGGHDPDECESEEGSMERICGEHSSAVCGESGP